MAATTSAEREAQINKAGFPEGRMDKYSIPAPADEKKLQKILNEAREAIYMNPDEWIRSILPVKTVNADLRRGVFNAIESIDSVIWVCKEKECLACSTEGSGCATARTAASGMAVALLVHPCLILGKNCVMEPKTLTTWAERVLGQTVFYKLSEDRSLTKASRVAKSAASVIKKTTAETNALLSRCPGPFTASGYQFLRRTNHLSDPVAAYSQCAGKLLSALKQIPTSCKELSLSPEWAKFETTWLKPGETMPERCDETCGILLCQAKDKILYLAEFGEKKRILIPARACEGEKVNSLGENLLFALPEKIRNTPAALVCAKKLDPSFNVDSR